jgi:hypothetical protein
MELPLNVASASLHRFAGSPYRARQGQAFAASGPDLQTEYRTSIACQRHPLTPPPPPHAVADTTSIR